MQVVLSMSSSCSAIMYRCCEGPAVSCILNRLCRACLNCSLWNDYCSVLAAEAENSVLPGKKQFCIPFPYFFCHSLQAPYSQFDLAQSKWIRGKWGVKSSLMQGPERREVSCFLCSVAAVLVLSSEQAGNLSTHLLALHMGGTACWSTAGWPQSKAGMTRPVLLWYDTNSSHRPKPACPWHPTSDWRQQESCGEAWGKKIKIKNEEINKAKFRRRILWCHGESPSSGLAAPWGSLIEALEEAEASEKQCLGDEQVCISCSCGTLHFNSSGEALTRLLQD